MLGRCHAALGQHELSAAAFDASIEMTRTGRLLMSEALGVRGHWLAGMEARTGAAGAVGGVQWSKTTGRARLAEVGHMKMPAPPSGQRPPALEAELRQQRAVTKGRFGTKHASEIDLFLHEQRVIHRRK